MCQYMWPFIWHENNILFWPLARSAFFIYHLIAEIMLTEYQKIRDQPNCFIGCQTSAPLLKCVVTLQICFFN